MAKAKPKAKPAELPTLFDVPATRVVYNEPKSVKDRDIVRSFTVDTSTIGLNAVFSGRSDVYKNFQSYIRNEKNKIERDVPDSIPVVHDKPQED